MKKDKTYVFFIFPNFNVSGVLTFAVNLARYLNTYTTKYKAILLVVANQQMDEKYHSYFSGVPVKILNSAGDIIGVEELQALADYINGFDKAIVFPCYYFNIQPILPFLHNNVKKIQVLHSDENVYYDNTMLFGCFYDYIVCVSSYIFKELHSKNIYFNTKSSMIHYGVDIPNSYKHIFDKKIKIVYFGRIVEEQKKVSRMIKIIKALKKTDINFEWTFIGEGSEIETIRRELSLEIQNNEVKLFGSMSVDNVKNYIYSQDIYILTSDYEGTPLAVMEAMGCGCIPIANDIKSGIPEMIEHRKTGYIVKDSNIDLYVKYIQELYNDLDKRKIISKNAYEYAKCNCNTSEMAKKYIEIFDSFTFKNKKNERKHIDLNLFFSLFSIIKSETTKTFLNTVDSVAIFGLGVSGQRTYKYIKQRFKCKVKYFIDDNKTGSFENIPIVDTDTFLRYYENDVKLVVFGAFQKVNDKLLKKIKTPYIRMMEVI